MAWPGLSFVLGKVLATGTGFSVPNLHPKTMALSIKLDVS